MQQDILVIDDNDDIRFIIVATLEAFGFKTREARNGREGIKLAREKKPDLIVSDVDMPEMDGFSTLAAIRAIPAIAAVPFIFLTGSTAKDGFRRAMASGADDFLTKPFRPQDLVDAVNSRLARRRELRAEVIHQSESLRAEIIKLLSREFAEPIKGIFGTASSMMREYASLGQEKVFGPRIKSTNRLANSIN